jgi:Leucine-rich repeat (LRR) protein
MESYPQLRYIEIKQVKVAHLNLTHHNYLIYVSLKNCSIQNLDVVDAFLPNVQVLDFSDNLLTLVTTSILANLHNLKQVVLAGNPITSLVNPEMSTLSKTKSQDVFLDMSRTKLTEFDCLLFSSFDRLQKFNVSYSPIKSVANSGFRCLPRLQLLDARGCSITQFPMDSFQNLTEPKIIYTSNYRLCCKQMMAERSGKTSCITRIEHPVSTCDDY